MRYVRKNLIGFAEQEPMLVDEGIGFNLCFRDDISLSDLKEAKFDRLARILDMEKFVASRTLGYTVNEKNVTTSGGEKQKISILRVLLKNPDVMIFDEPTSALDAEAAKGFAECLREIQNEKIVIVITHSESLMIACDEVIRVP